MVAYAAIEEIKKENKEDNVPFIINYAVIEKAVKIYKSHRSAIDFDLKKIKSIFGEMSEKKVEAVKKVVVKMEELK